MKLAVFLSVFLILGCSPQASIDSLPDAKVVVESFIDGFQKEKYESLTSLYSDEFWEAIPKETWVKILANVKFELGDIEACELVSWNQKTQATTEASGNFVILEYACTHSKYDSTIVFTVYKPLSGGESKIYGQNMNSIGFLIE